MRNPFTFLLMLALGTAWAVAKEGPVGAMADGGTWRFFGGTEFPGAAGGLTFRVVANQPVAVLSYNFSGGGRYVSAMSKAELKADVSELRFKVKAEQAERIAVRLRDSSGQYHQFALAYSSPGEWQTVRQPLVGVKSPVHFQGNNDGVIAFPVVEIHILINGSSRETKIGELWISGVTAL